MLKSIQLLSLGLLVSATFLAVGLHAQCELTPLPSTSYQVGTCGGKTFQSITGSLLSISGSCGGYEFGTPLTGGDVITGVKETSALHKINVYPNPTLFGSYIEVAGLPNYQLQLKTLLGSPCDIRVTDSYIDMSYLLPGLYLLEIRDSRNRLIHIEKIIKL
ncbi:MAG: hypothetical protein KBF57_12390 [Saprospiraceae bacterium]|nr:hypothetical protein [Saprospiraceae bacterium]